MPESESETSTTGRPFGLWSATFLVVANMIGAGVFTTSGFSFADLGDRQFVMYAWLIGSLIAVCGAISYGQLAQRITESGGEYLFLSRMVHPSIGFIAGWVSLLAGFTGAIAFAATAFESYAIPESIRPGWFQPGIAAIASIVLFGMLHSFVLKTGVVAQNLVVVLKLVLLAAFVAIAFAKFPSGWEGMQIETETVTFSVYAIASTLVWISLSFSGFNAAVYITGEVENPKTNVPRALLLGTLIVSGFYLALNFAFLFGPEPDKIRAVPDVAAAASQAIGGNWMATLIRVIVSVALLSSVSSMVIAGPRVYAKMAEDGVFPKLFNASKGKHHAVPVTAIWLQVAMASVVVYFSSLKSLLDYLGFTLSVSAAVAVACIFWTRRTNDTGLQRIFFSAIAMLYVLATIVLAVLSAINRPQQLIGFAVTIISGLVLYYALSTIGKSDNPSRNE
ncbi:APC family permease [Mariniblastus fucicola]|uniref:Serine/threonine exchanger SteT n=1 Tax=Mariniblastus fucicola TaxID=980251 RepID=A0A5B9PHY4_9BACT|nr:APC family permease [Mariniblastus fucicola]QEG24910.1 Serine/threonine exchanger SteT [Mariniblastus fucicola]